MAKVHELAKELGLTSKELLAVLEDLGIEVKSHMSKLSEEDEKKTRDRVSAMGGSGPKKESKAKKKERAESKESMPKASIPGAPPFAADIAGAPPFAGVIKPIIADDYFEKKKKADEAPEDNKPEEVIVETSEALEEKEEKEEVTETPVEEKEGVPKAAEEKGEVQRETELPSATEDPASELPVEETQKPRREEGQRLKIISRAEDEPKREKKPASHLLPSPLEM